MTLPISQFSAYCAITLKLTLKEEIWIKFCKRKSDLTFLIIITTSFTTLLLSGTIKHTVHCNYSLFQVEIRS